MTIDSTTINPQEVAAAGQHDDENRASILARSVPSNRCLHLIDVENLAGGPDGSRYRSIGDSYRQILRPRSSDLLTVGCDASGCFEASGAFPGCRLVVGRGQNGADYSLTESVDLKVLRRFGVVVIASGDHHFTLFASMAKQMGLTVVVVAMAPGYLSMALSRLADSILYLDDHTDLQEGDALKRAS